MEASSSPAESGTAAADLAAEPGAGLEAKPKGMPSEAATPYSTTESAAFAPAATPPEAFALAPEAHPPAALRATPFPAAPASEHGLTHAEHAKRGSDMANSASVKRRMASLKNSQRGLKPTSIATSATAPVAISVKFARAGAPTSKSGSERVSARKIPRPSAANKPPNRTNGDTPIRLHTSAPQPTRTSERRTWR